MLIVTVKPYFNMQIYIYIVFSIMCKVIHIKYKI